MKIFVCAFILLFAPQLLSAAPRNDCVILLHGLMRSADAMEELESAANAAGYLAVNIDYDSLAAPIEIIAPDTVNRGLTGCRRQGATPVHFITHSLGGILLRYELSRRSIPELGNSVMIAPPNQGSEVVDVLRQVPGMRYILGPAGLQLGTEATDLPRRLGPLKIPSGVIAGNRTINPLLSLTLPNPDDGKVSVAATRVEGMRDFIVLQQNHVFIMKAPETIRQSLYFLEHQHFDHSSPHNVPDPRQRTGAF